MESGQIRFQNPLAFDAEPEPEPQQPEPEPEPGAAVDPTAGSAGDLERGVAPVEQAVDPTAGSAGDLERGGAPVEQRHRRFDAARRSAHIKREKLAKFVAEHRRSEATADVAADVAARLGKMLNPTHGVEMERQDVERGLRMVGSFASALELGSKKRTAIFPRDEVIAALGGQPSQTGESCRGAILRYLLPHALALADYNGGHMTMTSSFCDQCKRAMRLGTRAVRECRADVRAQNVEERDRRKKEKAMAEKRKREKEERMQERARRAEAEAKKRHWGFKKKKKQLQAPDSHLDAEDEQEQLDAKNAAAALGRVSPSGSPRAGSPLATPSADGLADHSMFNDPNVGASQAEEMTMLRATLEDPYLLHVVLPQLETWMAVFSIFDLRREGRVEFSQLASGLTSCCTPEIAIFKRQEVVRMVTDAVEVVARVDRILLHGRQLLDDMPVIFGNKERVDMDEALRQVHSAIHESGVHVGGDVAALMKTIGNVRDDDRLHNPEAFGASGEEVLTQITEFRASLGATVREGEIFEVRNLYCSHRRVLIDSLKRWVRRRVLLRRTALLARLQRWDPDACREIVRYSKLKMWQRRIRRGMRHKNLGQDSKVPQEADEQEQEAKEVPLEITYLAWPSVLIRFYSESDSATRAHALRRGLQLLAKRQRTETARNSAGSEDSRSQSAPDGDSLSVTFPVVLLEADMMRRVDQLQRLLSNWNALVNLMDQSSSATGNLKVQDLRCAVMAMGEVGLLAEPALASHPVDERFQPLRRPHQPQTHHATPQFRPGNDHDYQWQPGPRKAVLLGNDPVSVAHCDAWALIVDFKVESVADEDGGSSSPRSRQSHADSSYSVLFSSYRGGSLVVRASAGPDEGSGVRTFAFFFVPCEILRRSSSALSDLRRFCSGPLAELYCVIKPKELRVDSWYSLLIQAENLPGEQRYAATAASAPKSRLRLGLRLDFAVEGEVEKITEPLHFSYWSGSIDFDNVYALGNVFDTTCSTPNSSLDWSIGPLRRFAMFKLDCEWLRSDAVLDKRPIHHLGWHRLRLLMVATRAQAMENASAEADLRHFLWKASSAEGGVLRDGDSEIVVEGMYRIFGRGHLHKSLIHGMQNVVTMKNLWAVEHEKGLHVRHMTFRRDPELLAYKLEHVPALIKSFLSKAPHLGSNAESKFWAALSNTGRLSFAPSAVFAMKNRSAVDEPGLNSLGTASQMRAAIKDMQRDVSTSIGRLRAVLQFLVLTAPFSISFWMLTTDDMRQKWRDKLPTQSAEVIGALDMLLLHLKRRTGLGGFGTRFGLVTALALAWCAFAVTAIALGISLAGVCVLEAVHPMEAKLAVGYYCWAAFLVALEVTTQVHGIPSDCPFRVAYKQAEVAMKQCVVINIKDGQRFPCTGAGFLQMVSRLDETEGRFIDLRDAADDDADAADDDDDIFSLGRGLLKAMWRQKPLQNSLPWKTAQDASLDPTVDFKVTPNPQTISSWEQNNKVYARGMVAAIDIGGPSRKSEAMLICMAALNACLGGIHRFAFHSDHAEATQAEETLDGTESCEDQFVPALGTTMSQIHVYTTLVCTFIASWVVYRVLFCTAFRWYMILAISKQMAAALAMDSAMAHNLPCYLNLRDKGNLAAWYCVREYVALFGDKLVFGGQSQTTIVSSVVGLVLLAFNAIVQFFRSSKNPEGGQQQAAADLSDPQTLFSLYNVLVMCSMIILALTALERINYESVSLLKRLDLESLELLTQIESRVAEFQEQQKAGTERESDKQALDPLLEARHKLEEQWATFKRVAQQGGEIGAEQVDALDQLMTAVSNGMLVGDRSLELHKAHMQATQSIVERHVLEDEYAYLQTIINKLRDRTDDREIFGLTIDRTTISRIMTGILGVLSILLKSTVDSMVALYMESVAAAAAADSETAANATEVCIALDDILDAPRVAMAQP